MQVLGDLQWVTLGFITGFLSNLPAHQMSAEDELTIRSEAESIKSRVEQAVDVPAVEQCHHEFHRLSGRILSIKLKAHIFQRLKAATA